MSERFRRLYQLPLNLYSIGSPIILSAAALQKDNQTGKVIVQLKFQSVTNKIIKAIKVSISAFDIENIELQGIVNYQYLDLHIHHGQYFGSDKAIILPDHVTRSFNVNSVKVYFDDNTETIVNVPLYPLLDKVPFSTVTSNYQLQKQYTLAINDKANYIPQERFNLWQCSCGEWNGTTRCSCCMIARDCVFTAYDIPSLTDKMEQRLALERAEAESAVERKHIEEKKQRFEAEQQEKLRQEQIQQRIKFIRKISIPIVCTLFATIVFTQWFYPNVVVPALAYMEANQLLENELYEEAKSAFNALGEYKDSPEKVDKINEIMLSIKYDEATKLYLNSQPIEAYNLFLQLGNYNDSISKANDIWENHLDDFYSMAINNYNSSTSKDILSAKNIFIQLGDYRESPVYVEKIQFLESLSGTYIHESTLGDTKYVIDFNKITQYENQSIGNSTTLQVKEYNGMLCALAEFKSWADYHTVIFKVNDSVFYRRMMLSSNGDVYLGDVPYSYSLRKLSNSTTGIKSPQIGMTPQEIQNSTWGYPEKINKTTYSWGIIEQWIYPENKYIYFQNNLVTAIQE